MRTVLEIVRTIIIFAFFLGLGWVVMENVYPDKDYILLGLAGIFILLFVFYRNKWQFRGWYNGKMSINGCSSIRMLKPCLDGNSQNIHFSG